MNLKHKIQWTLYAGSGVLFGGLLSAVSATSEPTPYDISSTYATYDAPSNTVTFNSASTPAIRRMYDDDDHHRDDDRYEHDDDHDHTKPFNRVSPIDASVYTRGSYDARPQQPTLQAPSLSSTQSIQTTRKVRTRLS
ncbi:MAG: hypothetical protein RBR24_03620 [Candidatus Carbobacillus sp.]|nr:hypothetical protein [Candidatus Carbobacillus sp.]